MRGRGAAVLACLLAACRPGPDAAGPADADALPLLDAVEVERIGSTDDPDFGFSAIADVAVDVDGTVFVADRMAKEVRVFRDGVIVRRIGRSGEGPGEFTSPSELGLIGDTLWVNDQSAGRITLFRRDGSLLATYVPRPPGLEVAPRIQVRFRPLRLRPDGTITSAWVVALPRDPPPDTFLIPWLRLDTAGAIVDTFGLQPFTLARGPLVAVGGRDVAAPRGPEAGVLFAAAPDGAWIVDRRVAEDPGEATFTVTRLAGLADTLYATTLRYRPRAFGTALVDSIIARWVQLRARASGVAAAALEPIARRALELPAFQPPIASAHAAEDGVLWLRRQDDGEPHAEWLLVGADGSALGRVRLPRAVSPRWSHGATLWAVHPDEVDVPWLVRYRIAPPGS